jgi:hypothetical protein
VRAAEQRDGCLDTGHEHDASGLVCRLQLTGSPTMADPSSPNLGWDATNNRMYVHTETRGGYWTLSGSNPIVGTWTQVSAAYNGTFNSIISTAYDWTDRVYMVVDSYDVANARVKREQGVSFTVSIARAASPTPRLA